jgi:GNAT superfamily N-acetyltransferase
VTASGSSSRGASVFSVRSATAADAAPMAGLSGVLGYPVSASVFGERLERLLARTESVILVAESSEGVVGWLHGMEQEVLESGVRCEILGLVVDPGCRAQGIGRGLVAAVERWAADRGVRQITVRSNVARAESHPFYQRLGYTRSKTQHVYRKVV